MGEFRRITPDQRNRALRRTRLLTSTVAGGSVAAGSIAENLVPHARRAVNDCPVLALRLVAVANTT